MIEELSHRAAKIIERTKQLSKENDIATTGSEYLLLAMYEVEDSLCHFLFDEYDVTKEELEEKTNQVISLRYKTTEFNQTLETLFKEAKILASDNKISDEHLFMAILLNPTIIASKILISLGLDIEDLITDVKEIYDFKKEPSYMEYAKNLTELAKRNELAVFVKRDYYLERINVILHRKYKNNPLLIGNAGVGKTALIEGYTMKLLEEKSDLEVISLNLTSMLAGTKYRGDFEQRFDTFIKSITGKKNIILFIDEIHTIMGAGTTEGNLDVANMLKPFLARADIKLIGATTIEEYHKTIEKDKALSRRFQTVFIKEPTIDETIHILNGIKNSYSEFHNVNISDEDLVYLIEESNRRIQKRSRPDKCIDILDDVMAKNSISKAKTITKEDIDNAIFNSIGVVKNALNTPLKYEFLNKYFWLYDSNLISNNILLKVKYKGNETGLNDFLDEVKMSFGISDEMILDIDFTSYKDQFMLTSLIGSPPGYVGHEDSGILAKHINSYPLSVIVLEHFEQAHLSISSFIKRMIKKGNFYDQQGRFISCKNTIFVFWDNRIQKNLGFSKTSKDNDDEFYDEVIDNQENKTINLENLYKKSLEKYAIEASFEFEINSDNKKDVDNYLYKFIKTSKSGKYNFYLDDNKKICNN